MVFFEALAIYPTDGVPMSLALAGLMALNSLTHDNPLAEGWNSV